MNFNIEETFRNHNLVDNLKKIIANLFLFLIGIILIPTLIITNLFKKKSKELSKEDQNKWVEFITTDKLKLSRKFINENDLTENIDLPEECNDVYAFEIKSEPVLTELQNVIFNFSELETENGIYLISLNSVGNGMSLWNINKMNNEIQIVTKLKSLWWEMSKVENKVILKGTEYNKDYKLEIEEK